MSVTDTPRPILLMRKTLKPWLSQKDAEVSLLAEWLQGYSLPPVGHEDDPFLWLLRGLPEADERYKAEITLATRAAQLLEQKPDVKRLGDLPEKLLYNLLMLCAGLGCPDQLSSALLAMLKREKLKGRWLGSNLRDALRLALTANQLDNTLHSVWETMSEGKKHKFLPGDELDGLEGARLMPESGETRGAPALDAIGKALQGTARRLDKEPTRRTKFRTLISRAIETYPGRPTWHSDLINQAHQHQWLGWAVECLPSLYVQLATLRNDGERALLWHYIAACIPKTYEHRVVKNLCNDHVVEMELSKEAARFVEQIAPIFEEKRVSNPFASERASFGAAASAMEQAERDAQSRGDRMAASTFKAVRAQLLKQKGVADAKAIGEALGKIAEDKSHEPGREEHLRSLLGVVKDIYPEPSLKKSILVSVKKPSWAIESLSQAEA